MAPYTHQYLLTWDHDEYALHRSAFMLTCWFGDNSIMQAMPATLHVTQAINLVRNGAAIAILIQIGAMSDNAAPQHSHTHTQAHKHTSAHTHTHTAPHMHGTKQTQPVHYRIGSKVPVSIWADRCAPVRHIHSSHHNIFLATNGEPRIP